MSGSDLVFVVGRQRSGTTVFRDLLQSNGAIDCNEIFHGDLTADFRFYKFVAEKISSHLKYIHPENHEELFYEYIEDIRNKTQKNRIIFDVKYFSLDSIPTRGESLLGIPFIFKYIKENDCSAIHIIRKNKLKVFVSEEIANKTGIWSASDEDSLLNKEEKKINIDIYVLIEFINSENKKDNIVSILMDSVKNNYRLYYESMFSSENLFSQESISIASQVMNKNIDTIHAGNLKMNPESLEDLVYNYEEVYYSLKGTRYEWMLY